MYNLMKNKNIDTDIILNSLQNPIIVINSLKKTIVYCNNETESFLNISKKQIIGKKIDDIFVSDSNFINIINKSISDNRDSLVHNMRIILYKKAIDISVSISKTNVNKLRLIFMFIRLILVVYKTFGLIIWGRSPFAIFLDTS